METCALNIGHGVSKKKFKIDFLKYFSFSYDPHNIIEMIDIYTIKFFLSIGKIDFWTKFFLKIKLLGCVPYSNLKNT